MLAVLAATLFENLVSPFLVLLTSHINIELVVQHYLLYKTITILKILQSNGFILLYFSQSEGVLKHPVHNLFSSAVNGGSLLP